VNLKDFADEVDAARKNQAICGPIWYDITPSMQDVPGNGLRDFAQNILASDLA
jgi:hypothetical protein